MDMTNAITGGHDLYALERFQDTTRHMIILDVLTEAYPVGSVGDRLCLFLTDESYAKAQELDKHRDIKIIKHAAIIEGHILNDKKKRRRR